MAKQKVVIVTGANRGIGLAICESILGQHGPVKLYACSRAGKDLGLKHDKSSETIYPKLDVTQSSQITSLASSVKATDGEVDVLINNAGLNKSDTSSLKDAEEIMEINYRGTLSMCQNFLPLMAKHGRIVNVSSVGSKLHIYPKEIQDRFRNPNMSLGDVDTLAREYVSALSSGKSDSWGPRAHPYCVSKACVNALTATMARENSGLLVNCCCPGWVDTEMGNIVGKPSKTPEQGAKIPVKLGFGEIGGTTGRFWENPGVSDTGDGQVSEW